MLISEKASTGRLLTTEKAIDEPDRLIRMPTQLHVVLHVTRDALWVRLIASHYSNW
jgi:hypothetical protein